MKRVVKRVMLSAAIVGGALATAGTANAQSDKLQMLTSPIGSMVYSVGSAISSVVTQKTDTDMVAAPMGGPQVVVPRLNRSKGDFTLMNAADAHDALRGVEPQYRKASPSLRLVSVGFSNPLAVLVRADSPIQNGADIKGKRVTGVFSAHKTCASLATAQLANLGLTWDDVDVVPVTHSQKAALAIAENRAEVAMCVPIGQSVVKEVNAQVSIRFLSLDNSEAAIKRLQEHFPVGDMQVRKKGIADGVLSDVNVWNYYFYLVTSADTSDEQVERVVKTVYENLADLRAISPIFKSWVPENMASGDMTIPYHPGAIKFYKSVGKWSDALEKQNNAAIELARKLASKS